MKYLLNIALLLILLLGMAQISVAQDTTLHISVCESKFPFDWNGHEINEPGVYQDTLLNSFGKDSTMELQVDMSHPITIAIDTCLCAGTDPFIWNGHTIYTDRDKTYHDTLINILGCDSILKLSVTILPPTITVFDTVVVKSSPKYKWNNLTVFTDRDSTYRDTLVNSFGCDSLVTYNLFVLDSARVQKLSLCKNQFPLVWWGNTIYTEGLYRLDYLYNWQRFTYCH